MHPDIPATPARVPLYRIIYTPAHDHHTKPFESCMTAGTPGITWGEARHWWEGGCGTPLAHQWGDGDHYVLVQADTMASPRYHYCVLVLA